MYYILTYVTQFAYLCDHRNTQKVSGRTTDRRIMHKYIWNDGCKPNRGNRNSIILREEIWFETPTQYSVTVLQQQILFG